MFIRMMQILNSEYSIFMKALYSEDELDLQGHSVSAELMQKLQELRKMMEARIVAGDSANDEESDDCEASLETVNSPDDIAS